MKTGEPPGRPEGTDSTENQPSPSPRPLGINVSLSFREPTHGNNRFLLKRPLEDSLHDATVMRVKVGEEETFKKTIAIMQGITTQRDGDNVNYKARIAVSPDHVGTVEGNVRTALETLMRRFKAGFSGVTVDVDQPPTAEVELNHEAADRDGEQRENDGNPVSSEVTRA